MGVARPRGAPVAWSARALLVALWLGGGAQAAERFDHRGAAGLLVGTGLEHKEQVGFGGERDGGPRALLDLGGTAAVGHSGNEFTLFGRAALGGPGVNWALVGGYRGFFGADRLKTFFDLDLAAQVWPAFTLGPRIGFGAQYELSPLFGVIAAAAGQLGAGAGLRFSVELTLAVQARSYLLE
jgi:hypothetical protein